MIRLAGAALLVGGFAAVGFAAVGRLDGRVRDLRGLIAGLESMGRELRWRLAPMPELLRQAAEESAGPASALFLACAQGMEQPEGSGFCGVWRRELERCRLRLEPADRSVLEQLGGVLGRYDGGSQCKALAAAVERLERQREEAVSRRARLGRVYGMLGVTAGVFLMILLI